MVTSMRGLIGYIIGIPLRSGVTTRTLLTDSHRLRWGVAACLLLGTIYTVSVFVGCLNGFGAIAQPWLPIPAQDHYLWETFFTIPAFFLILVTQAAGTQLVARLLRGVGTFEDTFAVLSLGIVLPTFLLMWVPETLVLVLAPQLRAEALGGFPFMPEWLNTVRQIAVPLWAAAVWMRAMPVVHGFGSWRATLAVVVGLIPGVVIALVFIR